jgi:hypothetical protein
MRDGFLIGSLILATACSGKVHRDFDALYELTLAEPPPLGARWEPDATVLLSSAALREGFSAGLTGANLETRIKVPGFSISPRLRVDELLLSAPRDTCEGCVGLSGKLIGDLDYKAVGLAGRTSLGVGLKLDAMIDVQQATEGWVIEARPMELYDAHLTFGGNRSLLADMATGPLIEWLGSQFITPGKPYQLARLGDLGAPVRGLRLHSTGKGLLIDIRTSSIVPMSVDPPPPVEDGWSARLGVEALMAVVRANSFTQGAIEYGVWVDPSDISFEDQTFTLSLRMWRPQGAGWWRDYQIEGDYSFVDGSLKLQAYEVSEVAASPAAGAVDPLVLLAKGRILHALGEAVSTTLPTSRTQDIAGIRTSWSVTSIRRDGDDLVITGDVSFDDVAP